MLFILCLAKNKILSLVSLPHSVIYTISWSGAVLPILVDQDMKNTTSFIYIVSYKLFQSGFSLFLWIRKMMILTWKPIFLIPSKSISISVCHFASLYLSPILICFLSTIFCHSLLVKFIYLKIFLLAYTILCTMNSTLLIHTNYHAALKS